MSCGLKPYFERDGITVYHASCLEVMATLGDRSVGCTFTDPPYTNRVHGNMRSNKGRKGFGKNDRRRRPGGSEVVAADGRIAHSINPIDFPAMTTREASAYFAEIGRVTSRWVVATVAFEHAARLYEEPPPGLRPIRTGVWVKIGPTPQMTGDRPAQGWEAVALLHANDGPRMHWNGGGKAAVWHYQAEMRGGYPTQKPEPLISRLIADFADPSDLILDPFLGAGTTLACAWRAGHPAIGCDVREEACEIAAKRLELVMAQGRLGRSAAPSSEQVGMFGGGG